MNPPTKGHEKLILAGKHLADAKNAEFFVFPSKTQDNKKNPLDIKTKVSFLRRFFPDVTFLIDATIEAGPVRTPFEALKWIDEQGYNNAYMVVGSDRVSTFKNGMGAYVLSINPDADSKWAYSFDKFDVISAGERDPDSNEVEGISGTMARQFIIDEQEEEFINLAAPSSGDEKLKRSLYTELRKILGETK